MSTIDDDAGVKSSGIIMIVGIGQSLRGDDGAGLAAVQFWLSTYPNQARRSVIDVELVELPGIDLLNILEGAKFAILVDGVRSGGVPGSIHLVTEDQLDSFDVGTGSAHGWGVAETLLLGRKLYPTQMPGKLFVVGIEAGQVGLGEILSPEVESALPVAARLIEQLVEAALAERFDSLLLDANFPQVT